MRKHPLKMIALILCAVMLISLFAGCGKNETPVNNTNETKPAETKPAETKPVEKQFFVYNNGQEPDKIDPGLQSAANAGEVCIQVFEGLMTVDKDNKIIPAAAEKVDYDPANPTRYVFHIRKDAKWSDGQPVKAQDFEYAWKRVLDPVTAADYANYLFYIKNGEAFNQKKVSRDDVGVKAKDDYTLEVELENLTPFFLELCSFATYFPVRKDVVEKDPEKWAQKPETYIGNGPFKMKTWVHDSEITFEKNEYYWDKANVKLDGMKFVMIAQQSQALAAWETGEVEYIQTVPTAEIPRLLKEKKMEILPYMGTYYVAANCQKPVLNDPRVRKALSLAIDRVALIETVWKDGRKPATGFVPYGVADVDPSKQFRDVGGHYYDPKGNVDEAKKLLAEAGYPDGKGFPTFEYAYNKDETHALIAQAIQDMWKKNLGINVKLNETEWKTFLPQRKKGNYEMSRDGWIGDYMDPSTFTDLFTIGNGNNDPQYKNPKYDELIKQAMTEVDQTKRFKLLHQAEDILIKEDMGLIPVAFYVRDVCIKPYIKGSYMVPTGMIFFRNAYIEGKTK